MMLHALLGDHAVEIDARQQIADDAGSDQEQPERRFAVEAEHRQTEERGKRQHDGGYCAREEKICRPMRIVDAGPNQAAAQHLDVGSVERRIMLCRIIDQLLRGSQSGMTQRTAATGAFFLQPDA